jgi:hypothetical protein
MNKNKKKGAYDAVFLLIDESLLLLLILRFDQQSSDQWRSAFVVLQTLLHNKTDGMIEKNDKKQTSKHANTREQKKEQENRPTFQK